MLPRPAAAVVWCGDDICDSAARRFCAAVAHTPLPLAPSTTPVNAGVILRDFFTNNNAFGYTDCYMRKIMLWIFGLGVLALLIVGTGMRTGVLEAPFVSDRLSPPREAGSAPAPSSTATITNSTFHFSVSNPRAGMTVDIRDAFVINPSWIAIFEASGGSPVGAPLGGAFFENTDGPQNDSIRLARPLIAGHPYVGVLYEDDGDQRFDPLKDFAIIRPDGEKAFVPFAPEP